MFEEVPRTRRGLAGLAARHIMLGPFLIGALLLAAVGGSVAFAATVITASSTRSDVPPPARHPAPATSTGHRPASAHQRPATPDTSSSHPAAAPAPSPARPSSRPPESRSASGDPTSTTPASSAVGPVSPALSSSGPAGNAIIHVSGFDQAAKRLRFQFAEVSYGTGPGGSDVYRVSAARQYSATLAGDLTITSGSQLCPPVGSSCGLAQLAAAADAGFFAIAAIDPADQLHSILEVDNVDTSFGPAVSLSPSPSPTNSIGP